MYAAPKITPILAITATKKLSLKAPINIKNSPIKPLVPGKPSDAKANNMNNIEYFVLSALSSGLLLYGCSLVYGFSGSTNFDIISNQLNSEEYVLTFGIVFILVGLAFKISAVPFHMWAPDVYEGSPTTVTLFFTIVPKVAAFNFIKFKYFISH